MTIDTYIIDVEAELKITSEKDFDEIYLWDSKTNCHCLTVAQVLKEENLYIHTFKKFVHKVCSNILDRKYVLEFAKSGSVQDLYQIDYVKFRTLRKFFLTTEDIKITQEV